MARIRSLHPSQWTDEKFVSCSPLARLLTLGLRNEADDQGIFEWKPLVLRMRLFPADAVDIEALLQELVDNDQIKSFEDSGKLYGAIRNFLRYQRPKAAKAVYPLPDALKSYVGIFEPGNAARHEESEPGHATKNVISEITEDHPTEFPQNGEIPSQMKEEGGRRKDEKKDICRKRKVVSYPEAFETLWKSYPTDSLMSKKQALEAWQKLDSEDRKSCIDSVPGFKAYCKSHPDYRPVHLNRYISQRRFDGMLEAGRKIAERQRDLAVFVAYDTPQWWAWDKYLRAKEGRGSPKSERTGGWNFPSEWPPKELAHSGED